MSINEILSEAEVKYLRELVKADADKSIKESSKSKLNLNANMIIKKRELEVKLYGIEQELKLRG